MQETYAGSTTQELAGLRRSTRMAGVVNQTWLFPHRGDLTLTDDELILGGWRALRSSDITSVSQQFVPA